MIIRNFSKRRGFSLVEGLLSVAVLAITGGLVVSALQDARTSATEGQAEVLQVRLTDGYEKWIQLGGTHLGTDPFLENPDGGAQLTKALFEHLSGNQPNPPFSWIWSEQIRGNSARITYEQGSGNLIIESGGADTKTYRVSNSAINFTYSSGTATFGQVPGENIQLTLNTFGHPEQVIATFTINEDFEMTEWTSVSPDPSLQSPYIPADSEGVVNSSVMRIEAEGSVEIHTNSSVIYDGRFEVQFTNTSDRSGSWQVSTL